LCIPEAAERRHLNDGYCLWLGTSANRTTKLLRSTVEVMHAPDLFLRPNEWEQLRIEKTDNNIHVYMTDSLQLSYISHLPLSGTHVGLLARDADFSIKDFFIYVGSQNVTVNCLAVPDAFLAHNDYATALNEYRRIGYSFPGRAEGREAMFRAGITLLEQAKSSSEEEEKRELYDSALEEFEKLHHTPGAPLEYLGKALVYQQQGDVGEEAKCFELAYRRYPKHPLLSVLQEQLVFRLHDSARYDRQAAFSFFLLVIRYLPKIAAGKNCQKLRNSIEKHWEPLFFIEEPLPEVMEEETRTQLFGLKLAFWLARPYVLSELAEELMQQPVANERMIGNARQCPLLPSRIGSLGTGRCKIPGTSPFAYYRRIATFRI
jgi:serine/threonine-protein kinase